MIPGIEGVGEGALQISFRQTEVKDARKKYGDGQCSTMSAHKDEWDAVRISRAAVAAPVLFSRTHPARAGKDCEGHVGGAPVRFAAARRRELRAGCPDEDHPDARLR